MMQSRWLALVQHWWVSSCGLNVDKHRRCVFVVFWVLVGFAADFRERFRSRISIEISVELIFEERKGNLNAFVLI